MISLYLMLLAVSLSLTSISLFILFRNFYKHLHLPQVYSLIITAISFLASEILEIIILFSHDISMARILVMLALVLSNTGLGIFLLFLESLRSPVISKLFFGIIIFMPILKVISLMVDPIKLNLTGSIITRQLALTPLNLIPTLILIFIFFGQTIDLSLKALKNKKKASFLLWILTCWILPVILILVIYFAASYFTSEIAFTYLQYLSISLGIVLLALFTSKKKMELFVMPIDLIGILVSTSSGVLILKEIYDEIRSSAIDLASIISGVVLMFGEQINIQPRRGGIAKIDYPELTYLIYSTGDLIISLVLNGDNFFIRSMLKNFGNELEMRLGRMESIVTDYEINAARELIQKYFSFIK